MRRIILLLIAAPTLAIETGAQAQVCSQPTPGVAQVDTNGASTTIAIDSHGIAKVNGVSCGFAPTSIEVVGVGGKDTVALNYVPPTIPVTMSLGGGPNNVTVFGTNNNDTMDCSATALDRDGNGTADLDFGVSTITSLTLNGRGGFDVLYCADAGYKVILNGGDADDDLTGGPFNDTIDGGNGNDILHGLAGNDSLNGNAGDDLISGDDGNDTFVTKATFDGNDHFIGGAGTDNLAYSGRTTPQTIGGPASEDTIDDDVETIKGGKSDDTLDFSTATANHNLWGGPGNDTLRGGAGADKLYGEAGNDTLTGGASRDTVIDAGDGDDTIGVMLDGNVETIKCGLGTDTYTANDEDTFKDCELVASDTPSGAMHVVTGNAHSCALLAGGSVKCWGNNNSGQLGLGDLVYRGRAPGEMGAALPAVDLGTGRTAVALAAGSVHTCALLDDATVKCWGNSNTGQLGQGTTSAIGDEPGEMGDALPAVDLGTGHTAIAIAAGNNHTCAILDDHSVKCWGWNIKGQLGLGSTSSRGDNPGEMGDALPAVDLGTGRTAVAIRLGSFHTCALLDDGTVKCWGNGASGVLGQGNTADHGTGPGSMGDSLPPIDLGTGRTAIAITTGDVHACAILDDGTMKCWGTNNLGQLGQDDIAARGKTPGTMGDALLPINLGAPVVAIAGGASTTCAILDDHSAKCWGYNTDGGLGQGDTTARGGNPGDMAALSPIALGTGHTASELDTSGFHACAKLDDATLKCWGLGFDGALGLEDQQNRGDNPGEMGDALPTVNLAGTIAFAPDPSDGGGCSTSPRSNSLLLGLALLTLRRKSRR